MTCTGPFVLDSTVLALLFCWVAGVLEAYTDYHLYNPATLSSPYDIHTKNGKEHKYILPSRDNELLSVRFISINEWYILDD